LPVAYHCIFKLGFQRPDNRVLAHSLFGCLVYGAFAAKVTILRLHRFPKHVLPLAGGVLFATLVGVWYTSTVWLYNHTTAAAPAYAAPSPIPANANAAASAKVFAQSGCGGCHMLAAANAHGQLGPSLDTLKPVYDQARLQVERGGGSMPSFEDKLTPQQIRDVAAFVASSTGP
jgi:mono/diheme cytochrome c family protein